MYKNLPFGYFKLCSSFQAINLTSKRLAGHSKWQNIKHIKTAKDAARNLLFTRLSRQIKIAVIAEGGSTDVNKNLKLEQVVEQAKRANMPAATVQSVLKSCESDKTNSKPHLIEIKGAGGCIILCEVLTNNLHLLKQNISTLLRKNNGKYSDGGGKHLFDEKGVILTETVNGKEVLELATEHAIEAGAEDVRFLEEENTLQFLCGASNLTKVTRCLEKFNYKVTSATVEFFPLKLQELNDEDLKSCANLCEKLEAMPEVVKLSDNIA